MSWLSLEENGKRLFKKAILKVGQFQKDSDGTRFEFTKEHLEFFNRSFSNRIPTPLEHTTDPEKNRGWVTRMELEDDTLYGIFELSETIQDPKIFDVSVNIPIVEGRVQPIDHVALTSYPVVKGLKDWSAIACSLVEEKEIVSINFKLLGTALCLSEEMTEENAEDLLTKRFIALSGQVAELEKKLKEAEKEPEAGPKIDIEAIKASSPGILKLAKEGRKSKIESLGFSKAASDKLEKIYCEEDAIVLALSESKADNFEDVMLALAEHEAFTEEELTSRQDESLELSDSAKGSKESFLVQDAKRRAEAMNK